MKGLIGRLIVLAGFLYVLYAVVAEYALSVAPSVTTNLDYLTKILGQ